MSFEEDKGIRKISFAGKKRATVVNNVDPLGEGRVAVTIKELQPNTQEAEQPTDPDKKVKLDTSRIANKEDNQFQEEINKVNFIWVRPTGMRDNAPSERTATNEQVKGGGFQPSKEGSTLKNSKYNAGGGAFKVPRIGSEIYVNFEDADPQKPTYSNETPSLVGQAPPMRNVESKGNSDSITKKVNIEIMSEGHNGSTMYFDRNEDKNNFVTKLDNGTRMKMEDNNNSSGFTVDTAGGHALRMYDKAGSDGTDNANDNCSSLGSEKFISLSSSKAHHVTIDDTNDQIIIRTKKGHTLIISDKEDFVSMHTKQENSVSLDDKNQKILIRSTGGQFIDIDDRRGTIIIKSKSGQTVI